MNIACPLKASTTNLCYLEGSIFLTTHPSILSLVPMQTPPPPPGVWERMRLIHQSARPHMAAQEGSAQTTLTCTSLPSHPTPRTTDSQCSSQTVDSYIVKTYPTSSPFPSGHFEITPTSPAFSQVATKLKEPLCPWNTLGRALPTPKSLKAPLHWCSQVNISQICQTKAKCLYLWKKGNQVVIR